MIRSKDALMSAEVSDPPSWNFTPSRMWKVYVRLSEERSHAYARSGTGSLSVSLGSRLISLSYLGHIGVQRLVEPYWMGSKLDGSASIM